MVSNRGELARGWYERVVEALRAPAGTTSKNLAIVSGNVESSRTPIGPAAESASRDDDEDIDDSDSDVGPPIPGQEREKKRPRRGPGRPGFDDLELQRGMTPSKGK